MAKSYQLKEIIGCETGNADMKSFGSQGGDEVEAKTSKFSSGAKFLDELKLWKIAMQIETFAPDRSNQK
jgi:hypothetical protein